MAHHPARHFDFLIVGGGMAADAAAKGIREQGADGTIGIIGEEPTPPFPRPALSKKLWTDPDFTEADAASNTDTAAQTGAELLLGRRATGVDPSARQVRTDDGEDVGYGRLLVATGAHPRRIDGLEPGDRVLYYRTLTDYHRLLALVADRPEDADAPHVAVVGGGYIGSEIAAAMATRNCRVTVAHPGAMLLGQMLPDPVARLLERDVLARGVELRHRVEVVGGEQRGDGVVLRLSDGTELRADLAVVGLGVEPAGALLEGVADRSEDGGIEVDEHLATSAAGVWAAGDVASYPDRVLGRRRVEHVDNATTMGTVAGRILAGSEETYDHTPMFYSDLFDHGYEAVGTLDSSLETYVDPVTDGDLTGPVVVYYADEQAVRGVLLWDHFSDTGVDQATALLAEGDRPADLSDLAGRVR